ncbi:Putative FBD-associated F-box protein At5g22720 [Linum perenne]
MEKRSKKSAAAATGKDLISDLPDEILHSIIRRIAFSEDGEQTAQQTITLSSRWRNLWRSYPVVQSFQLYSVGSEVFQKFHDATMKRFNQDKQLGMEVLKLSIQIDKFRSPAVEQLLKLASKRKAKYVDIEIGFMSCSSLCLPFRLLSSSSTKTLKLEKIRFASGNKDYAVVLNSLRSLHLNNVEFDDEHLFANLIASSPLLETLELKFVGGMRKLHLNAANLKKLEIYYCNSFEEIQIAAFGLRYLHIENSYSYGELSIGLIAPQLNFLKLYSRSSKWSLGVISCSVLNDLCLSGFTLADEQVLLNLIAGNPLLETLQLRDIKNLKELKLSNLPNLKTLVVTGCNDLKEIGLIAPQLNVLQISCCYNSSYCVMSCGDLNHLRSLDLDILTFDDEQVLPNLIAGNPLLETLQLRDIKNLKKLQLSNVPNLETLVIRDCIDLEEIGLIAPQLNVLKISSCFNLSFGVMSCGDLNHLRFLCLAELTFDDEQVFPNLIARNPLLETLRLTKINNMKKLQLSNVPNLETLVIRDCIYLEEIEIAAYELHILYLEMNVGIEKKMLHKIQLIAPQLNDLEIINYGLRMVDLEAIVCKLQYLKSLNLVGIAGFCRTNCSMLEFAKMFEFVGRKLEEFILWVSRGLKEMELDVDADAGLCIVKFLLYYVEFFDNNTIPPKISRHLKTTIK